MTVYLSEHTEPLVKNLTAILLVDFDTQFKPADTSGKIMYTGRPDVGARNHYIGVHPYLAVASLLGPRMTGYFGSTDKSADYMMLPDHFEGLPLDFVDHMIAYCLEHNVCVEKNNTNTATGGEIKKPAAVGTIMLDKEELIFGGMERMKIQQKLAGETDHDTSRLKVEMEIDIYL